ncbi:hypothetical protein J6590_100928 [Homalodisca vitripennis]|nr:hypothetical protein J6590_100928 [Homalodisca vitripennis]
MKQDGVPPNYDLQSPRVFKQCLSLSLKRQKRKYQVTINNTKYTRLLCVGSH